MIESLVDAFSGVLQFVLVALVALGACIGYIFIPDSVSIGEQILHPPALIKVAAGGFIAWLIEIILFGPALVLLDIRNAVRSINKKAE